MFVMPLHDHLFISYWSYRSALHYGRELQIFEQQEVGVIWSHFRGRLTTASKVLNGSELKLFSFLTLNSKVLNLFFLLCATLLYFIFLTDKIFTSRFVHDTSQFSKWLKVVVSRFSRKRIKLAVSYTFCSWYLYLMTELGIKAQSVDLIVFFCFVLFSPLFPVH